MSIEIGIWRVWPDGIILWGQAIAKGASRLWKWGSNRVAAFLNSIFKRERTFPALLMILKDITRSEKERIVTKGQQVALRVGILIVVLIGIAVYRFGGVGEAFHAVWSTFGAGK